MTHAGHHQHCSKRPQSEALRGQIHGRLQPMHQPSRFERLVAWWRSL